MNLLNSEFRYGLVAIILHCQIAIVAFGLFGLGL